MKKTKRGKTRPGAKRSRRAKKASPLKKFIFRAFFALLVLGGVSLFLLVSAVQLGLFGALPKEEALRNIRNPQGSTVYDREEKEIGRFYLVDRRSTSIDKLPECVAQCLVATEDARFYTHEGIDYRSLFRVFFKTLLLQDRSAGGGSTLSQQLAKNLFPRERGGIFGLVVNKIREMLIAKDIEALHDKADILELYLNTVPFGENVYGIEGAAQLFFAKSATELQCHEAATLIGMLKANTTYNPRLYPERSLERRNTVLALARKQGFFTEAEYEGHRNKPLSLNYTRRSAKRAFAAYYKAQVLKRAEVLLEDINRRTGSQYDIHTSSLRIHTGINAGLQRMAEAAVKEWMPLLQKEFEGQWKGDPLLRKDSKLVQRAARRSHFYEQFRAAGLSEAQAMEELEKPLDMETFTWEGSKGKALSPLEHIRRQVQLLSVGLVAMHPYSGEVLAWVGGIDHRYFQYDHVNSKPGRQTGSVFKPIVYASALEKGISPCQYYKAEQKTYTTESDGEKWTPGNADAAYKGKYSMEGALTESVNTVAVKVLEDAGIGTVIDNAENLGIDSDLPEVPSLALGTASIPLLEMVNAYCAFPNGGKRVAPILITRIENDKGEVIWEQEAVAPVQVFSKETSLLMSHMLQNVVNEGTGRALRTTFKLRSDLAGKTGTTQDNVDGWFIGFTPNLVLGAWVGNDNPALHFKTTALGQGAHTALPIVGRLLRKIDGDRTLRKYSRQKFETLPRRLERAASCDPFREEFKLFQWLFGKKKDRRTRQQQEGNDRKNKKGFFKKLFGKKE